MWKLRLSTRTCKSSLRLRAAGGSRRHLVHLDFVNEKKPILDHRIRAFKLGCRLYASIHLVSVEKAAEHKPAGRTTQGKQRFIARSTAPESAEEKQSGNRWIQSCRYSSETAAVMSRSA